MNSASQRNQIANNNNTSNSSSNSGQNNNRVEQRNEQNQQQQNEQHIANALSTLTTISTGRKIMQHIQPKTQTSTWLAMELLKRTDVSSGDICMFVSAIYDVCICIIWCISCVTFYVYAIVQSSYTNFLHSSICLHNF